MALSREAKVTITGDSSGIKSAMAEAAAALGKYTAAASAVTEAEALASSAAAELASAQRGLSAASKDAAAANAALERAEQALAAAQQQAEARQAKAVAAYDAKAAAAQAAAQREAAAHAAVAAAADQSAREQRAAQRELDAATRARARADAAAERAAAQVSAASESTAAATTRVAEAHARAQAAAQAHARAAEAVREAEASMAQASETAATASRAAAAASDAAAAARQREAQAAAQAARTVSEAARQQAMPQMMGPPAPSARGLEYLDSLRQQIAAQREQQILLEGGAQALARYRAAQAGVSAEAEHYISQLHGAAGAHGKATLTAGQMAQNMRMLPMQMGDVAVSLASGMPPLMVLMQQGMQIKDMYGSVGGALRAVGGYLLDLARNPMTLAAAATAVLAAGAWSASESQHALATAVTMSGAAAGLTASQLNNYANAAATAAGTTSGAAVEAITMLTKSGAVVPEVMQTATEAALALNRSGGQAVEDTVKIFAKLGQDPLTAAVELNKSFGFLTEATYEQIKAAMDSGDKHKAAQIAQEAYAASGIKAAEDIIAEMGLLQRAFLATKDIAGAAWQAISGVGANKTDKEISALREKAELGEISSIEWDRLTALESQKKVAEAAAEARKKEQAQIQAKAAWDKTINDGLTQYLPKAEREAKLAEKVAAIKAQGAAAGASQTEISARVAQAEDAAKRIEDSLKPKTKKGPAGPTVTQDFSHELAELQAAHAEKNAANNTFSEFSKAEELKFWQSKLTIVKSGSKEETEIRKKVADLKVAITKQEYEAEVAALKKSESEAGKNAETRLSLMRKTHEQIVSRFGAESKAGVESAARIAEAERAAEEQRQQLENIGAARADVLALAAIQAERDALDASIQLGLTASERKLQAEQSFQDRIFEIKRAALEREKTLISPDRDPVAYAQILTRITEIETQHKAQGQQLQRKQFAQDMQGWKSFADGVGNTFGQTITGIATGTASIGDILNGVVQSGMSVLSQMAAQWVSQQIMQRVMAAETAGTQITAAAGVAGANALASNAAAPWPLGLGAPAIAAGVVAAALGFKALASAEGGWYDTGSGNPLTQLHAREMVLPAHVASPMRDMIGAMPAMPAIAAALPAIMSAPANYGQRGSSVNTSSNATHNTYNMHSNASAMGDRAVRQAMERQGKTLAKMIKTMHRDRRIK